jgi:pimeloyl-ACP methyl ester carboxylesterase
VHNAIPAGGGFDELTSLICMHGAGQTGRLFVPLLRSLGFRRSVYALDLPGSGESDPAPGIDAVTAAAHAVADFSISMRLRSFDLLAAGDNETVLRRLLDPAAGLAVRRTVLLGGAATLRPAGAWVFLPAAEAGAAETATQVAAVLDRPA